MALVQKSYHSSIHYKPKKDSGGCLNRLVRKGEIVSAERFTMPGSENNVSGSTTNFRRPNDSRRISR